MRLDAVPVSGTLNVHLLPARHAERPRAGLLFSAAIVSPAEPRAVFIHGQNLFHSAREAFGYTYPNYDIFALAQRICETKGWTLTQVRF